VDIEDFEDKDDSSKNWLERMHSFLEWKVTCPECNNPFGTPMSTNVLIEFAKNREMLLRYVELKGNVDGEEIITLKNVTKDIEIITNHPAVIGMKKSQIKDYVMNSGVLKKIENQLLEAQAKYLGELKKRKIKLPIGK